MFEKLESIKSDSLAELDKGVADIKALEDLREAMKRKIEWDVDNIADTFTATKQYWGYKRWANIFNVPLKILEGTLKIFTIYKDAENITEASNHALDSSEFN